MRTIINIIGFIILIGFFCSFAFALGWIVRARIHENTPQRLPTIKEIQQRIGCKKIDGIWGKETNELYDRAICNQFAAEWFEGEE